MKFEIPQLRRTSRVGVWLFLRALALIHLVAFAALGTQIVGLVGREGILPANLFLAALSDQLGPVGYLLFPTCFWVFDQDIALQIVCGLGVAGSLLLFFNVAPALMCLILAGLYLSLVEVGQIFLSFQWDALLVETTVLAVAVCPWKWRPHFTELPLPPAWGLFLLRWLLFRFMLLCGLVKLLSGDQSWWQLTALTYHFETQPLPTWIAWWLHQAPLWSLHTGVVLMFVIELIVPFFVFGSAGWRRAAFVLLGSLQVAILLSGNHAFFNWLSLVLLLPLLDDKFFARRFRDGLEPILKREVPVLRQSWSKLTLIYGGGTVLLLASLLASAQTVLRSNLTPEWLQPTMTLLSNWRLANGYGVFAVMTTTRPEILIEGTRDGVTWLPYELPAKPGALQRQPPFVAPWQPRLDWQLWFAALAGYERNPWVQNLLARLLENSPSVKGLFVQTPFGDLPPTQIRAVLYDYQFTTPIERQNNGTWWKRELVGAYSPTLALSPARTSRN